MHRGRTSIDGRCCPNSLQGEPGNPGVVQRAMQDVFEAIEKTPGRDFLLRLSMLEIYNEVSTLANQPLSCLRPLYLQLLSAGRGPADRT